MPTKKHRLAAAPRNPERVERAVRLLAAMTPPAEVVKRLVADYHIKPRTARTYVEAARAELAAAYRMQVPGLREQLLRAVSALYQAAFIKGDFRSCLQAVNAIARICALDTGSGNDSAPPVALADTDPDAVRRRISELMGRFQAGELPFGRRPLGSGDDGDDGDGCGSAPVV